MDCESLYSIVISIQLFLFTENVEIHPIYQLRFYSAYQGSTNNSVRIYVLSRSDFRSHSYLIVSVKLIAGFSTTMALDACTQSESMQPESILITRSMGGYVLSYPILGRRNVEP